MKIPARPILALSCFLLVGSGLSGSARAVEPLSRVEADARRDLEASLAELSRFRASVAEEKVPLSEELARLEGDLAGLRRRSEEVSRSLETGAVDLGNLRTEVKLRQDEITYLGNLLDEYRTNLNSRLGVGEDQRYEPVLAAARRAAEDATLSPGERFDLRLAVVKTSIARLEEAMGGARFPGQAVDPRGVLVDGTFALVGPVALFASNGGNTAGLALPQTGSNRPAVRPLGESLTPQIARTVSEGQGVLPLDPTRGAALKALIQKTSLIHIFQKGGPIMWPLLLASVLALGTVVERLVFLIAERKRQDDEALQLLLDAVEAGDVPRAIQIGKGTSYFVCRALTYALEHREKSISNALMLAQSLELKRLGRGIPILDTIITLAPLLGLLGTVTGMMNSFSLLGGELSAPTAITGGIAEALIATAFGLGIAIVSLIPFNFLNSKVEAARHDLDSAATRLELLLHPRRDAEFLPAAAAS
jgi:biopolymer transport protein ExbB